MMLNRAHRRCAAICCLVVPILATPLACGHHADKEDATPNASAPPPVEPVAPPAPPAPATPAAVAIVDPLDAANVALDPVADRWWMEKATRAMTGKELSVEPTDPKWKSMTKRQFVEHLMASPGFDETVLAFNLYYAGFDQSTLFQEDGQLLTQLFDFPQAIAAARAMDGKGDFLTLLSLDQPFLVPPLNHPSLPGSSAATTTTTTPPPTDAEIRAQLRKDIDAGFDRLIAEAGDPLHKDAFCAAVNDSSGTSVFDDIDAYGIPASVSAALRESPDWFAGFIAICNIKNPPALDVKARLTAAKARLPKFLDAMDALDPSVYKPTSLKDLKVLDTKALGLTPLTMMSQSLFLSLQNSSTNFDRRRGSYVLKRYFCDDLTPIDAEMPASHAETKHASDPGCQSCHYKLDPIAGFFRDRGIIGFDFAGLPQIIFDDLATADTKTYEAAWKAPAGSGRTWDVGYVRSAEDPSLNSYGSSLQDLYGIIGKAPEARQCLVRRMFERYIGEEQVIDPGYLDYLTAKFDAKAADTAHGGGTAAFKETLERLVLSKTFAEQDLVSTQCYDLAPGTNPEGAPPCAVNYLLQRDCASCHGASGGAGGLNLTGWVATADGYTFPHLKDGKQVSKAETLNDLADRLNTPDASRRMPPSAHIPSSDREQLFLWVNDSIQHEKGH